MGKKLEKTDVMRILDQKKSNYVCPFYEETLFGAAGDVFFLFTVAGYKRRDYN